jgi:hypothetical protein
MKEIKLWEIFSDKNQWLSATKIDAAHATETEEELEEVITRCPELLMEDLKLIGRQTDTGAGPLDLLGVDSDGRLVVFELKRGALTRDAVAQIIDYASDLAGLEQETLSKHISERSGKLGIEKIDDFFSWYQEQFAKDFSASQKPRMVLVGLGADDRTRRIVSFLADSDIDIYLITFHAFHRDGKTFLARQVEVAPPPVGGDTKEERAKKLRRKVNELGIEQYYYELADFFRNQLSAYEWPNPGGYSYYLTELTESGAPTNRVYLSLYIFEAHRGKVQIRIQPRAVDAASGLFEGFKEQLGDRIEMRPDGAAGMWVTSLQDWQRIEQHFQELCPAIVEGWKRKREERIIEEHRAAAENTAEEETEEELS